jgi:hypothetical protein
MKGGEIDRGQEIFAGALWDCNELSASGKDLKRLEQNS